MVNRMGSEPKIGNSESFPENHHPIGHPDEMAKYLVPERDLYLREFRKDQLHISGKKKHVENVEDRQKTIEDRENKLIENLANDFLSRDAQEVILGEFKRDFSGLTDDDVDHKGHLKNLSGGYARLQQALDLIGSDDPEFDYYRISRELMTTYAFIFNLEKGRLAEKQEKQPNSYLKISSVLQNSQGYTYFSDPELFTRTNYLIKGLCESEFVLDHYAHPGDQVTRSRDGQIMNVERSVNWEQYSAGMKGLLAVSKFFNQENTVAFPDAESDTDAAIDLIASIPGSNVEARLIENQFVPIKEWPDGLKKELYYLQIKCQGKNRGKGSRVVYISEDQTDPEFAQVRSQWKLYGFNEEDRLTGVSIRRCQGFYIDLDPNDIDTELNISSPVLQEIFQKIATQSAQEWRGPEEGDQPKFRVRSIKS